MPIHCSLYDALELICLRRYRLGLILRDGSVGTGIASDVAIREGVGESLQLETEAGVSWVALNELAAVEVPAPPAPMRRLEFTGACEP